MLQFAIDDAMREGKDGLVTVAGAVKLPFMSDTKWLLRQGFEVVQSLPYGFVLLAKKINQGVANPRFKETTDWRILRAKCNSCILFQSLPVYRISHTSLFGRDSAEERTSIDNC